MMSLNDSGRDTSTCLFPQPAETSASSMISDVALIAMRGEQKRAKWTRHRDGEWTLRPGTGTAPPLHRPPINYRLSDLSYWCLTNCTVQPIYSTVLYTMKRVYMPRPPVTCD